MSRSTIHLDTSFLIRGLTRGSSENRALKRWLSAGTTIAMSSVAWTEFLCGPLSEDERDLASQVVTERPELTEEDAILAAELFNRSGRRRNSLTDCMIAAVALRHGAALATANRRDFQRFKSLGIELA